MFVCWSIAVIVVTVTNSQVKFSVSSKEIILTEEVKGSCLFGLINFLKIGFWMMGVIKFCNLVLKWNKYRSSRTRCCCCDVITSKLWHTNKPFKKNNNYILNSWVDLCVVQAGDCQIIGYEGEVETRFRIILHPTSFFISLSTHSDVIWFHKTISNYAIISIQTLECYIDYAIHFLNIWHENLVYKHRRCCFFFFFLFLTIYKMWERSENNPLKYLNVVDIFFLDQICN